MQQAYNAYGQNKGTLVPGQTIAVNNYTVQVERYLSQGGFAHVYLVRTPTPVYNTTHHVLKRIAVANEAMLAEVKKEVDVMRLLKGHPNIVHLIDAAWHKLPNGTFEVFILMEYCPGGGIIDMMNRRLRERLTEAEILQIFVDVCEGVAYMHNSRPPLLHRDLKVENILQSSPTSFKLCDFGSATTVSNPPTTIQEIRALENDLNRHTTLQYRAPEMVDVYSKRPVNEKSDVWALGVLLYKLCYYTTPFEEHGPLAILNVQYRTPPYPVYSQAMNELIASMLREHGAQRPTVFELLNHVHGLRGTKSKFTYNIPVPPPLLPRHIPSSRPSGQLSTNNGTVAMSVKPSTPQDSKTLPPVQNQGIQARDKVLEAIAPMRRGRPASSRDSQGLATSRQASPQRTEQGKNWTEVDFGKEQDQAWKAVTEKVLSQEKNTRDGFGLPAVDQQQGRGGKTREGSGFGDDFSDRLWRPSDATPNNVAPKISPRPSPGPSSSRPQGISPIAFTGTTMLRPKADRLIQNRSKDAFDGLGLVSSSSKPAPTLGEARKLRTGLAVMNVAHTQRNDYLRHDPLKPTGISPNPTPSPKPSYLSASPSQPQPGQRSPIPSPTPSTSGGWKPSTPHTPSIPPSNKPDGLPIESRFPSLEELDARFVPGSNVNALYPSYVGNTGFNIPSSRITEGRRSNIGSTGLLAPSTAASNGVRSEQVTGVAMRESKESRKREEQPSKPTPDLLSNTQPTSTPSDLDSFRPSPSLQPATLTTATFKEAIKPFSVDFSISSKLVDHEPPPKLPPVSRVHNKDQDWLTGLDSDDIKEAKQPNEPDVPILRDSPRKHASFIESNVNIVSSSAAQHVYIPEKPQDSPQSADLSPTVSKFKRAFPALDNIDTQPSRRAEPSGSSGLTDNWSPVVEKRASLDESSNDDEPEEPGLRRTTATRQSPAKMKTRQSSVHDLVHQYRTPSTQPKIKETEKTHGQTDGNALLPKIRPLETSGLMKDRISKVPPPVSKDSKPQLVGESKVSDHAAVPLPSGIKPSTSATRSRPQSMFLFPSKTTEPSAAQVNNSNLAPPKEAKPRPTRRTSISDMVQHYEAIGSSSKPADAGPAPPSPLFKPSFPSLPKSPSPTTYTAPISKVPSQSDYNRGRLPLNKESQTNRLDSLKTAIPASEQSSSPAPSWSPTKSASITLEPESRNVSASNTQTNVVPPRQRRMSTKAEAYINSVNALEAETSRPKKPMGESSSAANPPRKVNLFAAPASAADASSSRQDDGRSPSPERPYQGVGRLIDQWQKKTAEAEQSKGLPKRAPLNGLR
ncbi:hypothetical protein CVT24_008893 [Panaeolus cyanescens]|uniref:non-specific serine/threonine protein kinase n=1 Tax=Panaeolus cyanescens TaxID=181874 RepID=A0A409VEB6_9AGAR|nr:hypothetical protein CVT24_008893 [Panaeolus cyanescens]